MHNNEKFVMKKLLYLLLFLVSTTLFSQQLYHTKVKQFPSTDYTYKNILKYDQNGNKYIVGTFNGTTNFTLQTSPVSTSVTNFEIYIAKYNTSDSLIWLKQIRDSNNYGGSTLTPLDVEITSSGLVYLAYSRYVPPSIVSSIKKDSVSFTFNDAHNIIKLDANGNTIYNMEFEANNGNLLLYINDIALAPNDELFVTSFIYDDVNINPLGSSNIYIPINNVSGDIAICKYNSSGIFMRSRTIADTLLNSVNDLFSETDNDGNVYIAGIINGHVAFTADSVVKNVKVVGLNRTSAFLAKYNRALSLEYSQVIDPQNALTSVHISSLIVQKQNSNSLFAIAGRVDHPFDLDPSPNTEIYTPYPSSVTSYIAWYSKSTGNLVRAIRLGADSTQTRIRRINFIPNGNLILAGETDKNQLDMDPTDSVYILRNTQINNTHFIATYNSNNRRAIQARPIVYGSGEGDFFRAIAGTNSKVDILAIPSEYSSDTLREELSGSPFIIPGSHNADLYASFRQVFPVNAVTNNPSNITRISATVSGSINDGEKDTIVRRGFAYSFTNDSPLVTNADTVRVNGSYGSFNRSLQNLTPKRTYYYRAFVSTPSRVVYGVIDTFTTPFVVDTVKALSGVINNPPTSVTLNWNFPQERLITRKFYIYRATDSTTNLSNFTLIDSVARDTTDIAQTYTSSSLIGGNRYTFYVIAKADTIGPRSPFFYASLPAVPTAFSATKVLDTTKSITLSFSLAASDSATQRCIIYAVKGTAADSAQMIAIDTIVRLNKQTLFTKNYRTPFGKRIFDGTYTFRVRTLSKNVISEPTPFQTVVFAPDTLLIATTPKDSACQDFVYQQNIQTKYTGIGELIFSLVGGPNGMTIDPNTGMLAWTPDTESLPLSTVVVNVQSEYNPALKSTLEYKIRKVDCTPPPEYNVACGVLNVVIAGASGSSSTVIAIKVNENTQPDEIIEFKKTGTDTIRLPLPKGLYQVSLLQENGEKQWYNAVEEFESPDVTIVCDDSVQANFTYFVVDTTPITFSGVLRSALNNDPIVGSVRFLPTTSIGTTVDVATDTNGVFSASLVRRGVYYVRASAIGFLPTFLDSASNPIESRIVGPFDDNSSDNTITMKPRLAQAVSIRGVLLDEAGNRQSGIVAAYKVTEPNGRRDFSGLAQYAILVGKDGNWTLDNLETGGYIIIAIPLTGFAYSRTHVGGFYASNQNLLVDKWEDATIVPVLFNGVPLPSAIKFPLRTARPGNASFFGLISRDEGLVKGLVSPLSTITDPGVIIMLSDQNSKPAGFGISNNQGLVGITGLSGGTYNGTASKPGLNSIDFTVEIDPKKRPDTVLITLDKTPSDPPVSVAEKGMSSFTVSPNPVQSSMTIAFEQGNVSFVEIMDLSGKSIATIPILSQNTSSLQLSTMNIPNGAYYIVVTSKTGSESKLVIIQK